MGKIDIRVFYFFSLLFFFFTVDSYSEGTKELMPDSAANQRAFILIANGYVGGNTRDPFALYNGDEDYRLFIHIEDHVKEKIFFGLGDATNGGSVIWRIHAPDETVVWSGSTPTSSSSPGFIEYYNQAYLGPTKLNASGYPAIVVDPEVNGDYFMTFQVNSGSYRSYEKVDISVIDTTTTTYKKGRVFCKAWQANTNEPNSHGFYGELFVYSIDSLVTKFDPNGFEGMWFTVSCNNSGCYPVSPSWPATEARKSVYGWHNYPQYNIFLNDPDSLVYPSGIIGQVVFPPPPGNAVVVTPHCDDGSIDFTFEVTSSGTVSINLELSSLGGSYTDREIIQTVNVGINIMTWDGYDGSTPPLLIPSGSTFPFTLTYVKGMTHMPLWDVENNQFGFYVSLIRPASISEPAFHWDDTNFNPSMPPGPATSPPAGCLSSVSACHIWYEAGGQPGDGKTVNTWWYVSNETTIPVTIMKKQIPGNVGPIIGPSQICQGGTSQFTAQSDTNAQQYRWTWPGGVDTTNFPLAILTFPLSTAPGLTQVTVHGINAECGNGPTASLDVTVNEIPEVTNSVLEKTICSNTAVNISLTSNVSGATFAWRAYGNNPNLGGFYNSMGTVISQVLFNLGTYTDTVFYRIVSIASGCMGDSVTYKVAVHPIPDLSNSPASQTQCNNLNTLLELTSNITGTLFTWISIPSSGNISGYSNNSTPTDSIKDLLINSWFATESVNYRITPTANNCYGQPTDFNLTVRPTPDLSNNPPLTEICNGGNTGITLTSNVSGTSFTWT
nr:hypothetical protein [Bacteroidota bacterium]